MKTFNFISGNKEKIPQTTVHYCLWIPQYGKRHVVVIRISEVEVQRA